MLLCLYLVYVMQLANSIEISKTALFFRKSISFFFFFCGDTFILPIVSYWVTKFLLQWGWVSYLYSILPILDLLSSGKGIMQYSVYHVALQSWDRISLKSAVFQTSGGRMFSSPLLWVRQGKKKKKISLPR